MGYELELKEDPRLIDVLTVISNESGRISQSGIVEKFKGKLSRATIITILNKLEAMGLIASRKVGKKRIYEITNSGSRTLRTIFHVNISLTKGIASVTFTKSFIEKMREMGIPAETILSFLGDPAVKEELGYLIGETILIYFKYMYAREPFAAATFLKDGRIMFLGVMPTEHSKIIREAIERKVLKDGLHGVSLILNIGWGSLERALKEAGKGKLTITYNVFTLDENNNLKWVVDREKIKEALIESCKLLLKSVKED